ncbi:hypothetical protein TIFTF001_051598 [Ficus carica]|uniref:Zinc finger PMZ-type domain-containing protein n=1 Tax=Ficus carica TaxID=3494 RepID=A0AA87Z180_FICCA|nr:hypothetical protein TIFTF001_051597 [Ficus carica]GMN27521.1 hypothetical protein TIFTF001_051598 [Ficus carica]
MRYAIEPGMPPVRIQCDVDVKFYIQLKKKDVHVLSKFSISIDVLDESAAEAMPPEVGESNHIDVQPSKEGGQSDEAMQPINDSNLIILPPRPPHIRSPTVGLDLHTEDGIEKQHQLLNNDSCTDHDDCNAGELNVADAARHSNEKSIAASIGAHSIVNTTRTQSVNVSSSDSLPGSVVVVDFTPVTMRRNCIFDNKKLLQYHFHHDATSKHYQFKVKRSNSTLLHVICIDNEGCPWQLRATRMRAWRGKEVALTSLRADDAESYKAASKRGWPYCRSVIVVDGSALKARFGGMLLAACGHDANGSIFSSCIWYKDFKGPLKTYFDGASRLYPLSRSYKVIASILQRTEVCNHDNQHCRVIEQCGSESQVIASWILGGMVEGTTTKMSWPANQFEYAVTNNAAQIWIVDMSERTYTCRRFQFNQIPCPHVMAVCNHRRINPYNYCSNDYTKDYLYACYAHVVHPIGSTEGCDVSKEVRS